MSTFDSNIVPIEKLAKSVEEWVDNETVLRYFKKIFDKHENKWRNNLKADHWGKALVRKLLQVHERIKFTEFLESHITDEFETQYYYPQLTTYLRLTCFDQLGQPIKWIYIGDWLKSNKKRIKNEREQIIENIEYSNHLEFAQKLQSEYQKIYGIKNTFLNFINNVIPLDSKVDLLNSIRIRVYNETSPTLEGRQVTEKDKLDYLYRIRNDFTHNTYSSERIAKKDELRSDDWNFRERKYDGNNELWISTHKIFQSTIKRTVLIGLSERIKNEYGM